MSNIDNLIRYINEGELLSKEYEAKMSVLMSGIKVNLDQNFKKSKKNKKDTDTVKNQNLLKEKSATFLTNEILNLSLERANSKNSKSSSNADLSAVDKKQTKNTKQKQKQQVQVNNKQKPLNTNLKVQTKNVNSHTNSSTTTPSSINSSKEERSHVNTKDKQSDIRARYWAYLFDNLKRAVDEIYKTCENDDSISECKEVVMILENCTNDFRSLISRIQLIKDYEKIKSNQKSVAWEVRKSSPWKNYSIGQISDKNEAKGTFTKKEINNLVKQNQDSAMSGFKEFNPAYETLINNNNNNINNNNDRFKFKDEFNDEDDFDLEEFDIENNQKNYSEPIDLLNHETFSDLQSIHTDDVSFNTESPFTSGQSFFNLQPTSLNQLSIQTQYLNSLLAQNQQSWFSSINTVQQAFNQVQSQLNQNQFLGYNNLLSNSSELSPFNQNLNNQKQGFNRLNESYENASIFEDSFNFNNTVNGIKNKIANEFHDDDYDYVVEDVDEEDIDDVIEYEYLKNKKLNKHTSSQHHENILKFYEEEEKTIELEIKQDKKLLSVLNEEAKLTRQLSVEQLMHFNHQYEFIKKNSLKNESQENDDLANSKLSTDFETNETERNTPLNEYWKKVNNADDAESEIDSIRTPSRTLQVHEKLLTMPRKESPNERRRKHEEKQARAQEKREQFYQERLHKLRELTKKIEQVSELKKKLLRAKKATLKAKLQRAEEKRQYLLNLKSNKAAVEEQKAHEIAFINSLAAQNRKLAILEKHERRNEVIKQNIEEERLRKQEEQKAKEQAAELRRKELESQRVAKIKEMLEKRQLKQSKIEQTQLEKEKERMETAKAKVKSREMRLAIKEAQFQANKQQAKKRILQKQEEWSKRHELNLEEIRKKAIEMSILHFSSEDHSGEAPTPTPYEKPKYCKVCNVTINSEVQLKSHLRGLKHQQIMNETNQGKNLTISEIEEYNLSCIIDAPKENDEKEMILNEERKKQMKKRLKKLRAKISSKGLEYEANNKDTLTQSELNSVKNFKNSKIPKLIKEMEKNSNSYSNLDKNCSEISRAIQKNNLESLIFRQSNGPNITIRLLEQVSLLSAQQSSVEINSKCANNLINLLNNISKSNSNSSIDFLMSNKIMSLVEILNDHSNIMLLDINDLNSSNTSGKNKISNNWLICSGLFELFSQIFTWVIQETGSANTTVSSSNSSVTSDEDVKKYDQANLIQRTTDIIGLITSFGLIDTLSVFFSNIQGPLDGDQQMADILNSCLNFLFSMTKFLYQKKTVDIFSEKKQEDTTQLISTFKATNLVNIISMLYGMLHKDASTPVKSNHSQISANSSLNDKK
ncbi:unnamed protein product, partial [Brachionus calyciflorus]